MIGKFNTGFNRFEAEWYGIEWDVTVSNPLVTRIGNMTLHQSLPLQNQMRRCLLLDNGTVNYHLDANDSTLKEDLTPADLTGADGQVMVFMPEFWFKTESEANKRRYKMSKYPLDGYTHSPAMYISAYEAALERGVNKLSSVVNLSTTFRGGNNTSAWDGTYRSLLGRPVTNVSLTNFRNYARNRGSVNWNCNTYHAHRKLWWLFAVEYANFNSQDAYNAALTPDGYRQGGLDAGVTTLNGSLWNNFNGSNPFVPCGYTNGLGSHTGIVPFTMPAEYGTLTVQVPSYRGVENPFGHLWKWADGCKCMIQSDADGGLSEFYVCDNPANFTSSGTTNYQLRGNLPRTDGYVKEVILGEYGEIVPLSVGGGSTTYFCDYFYTSKPASGIAERGFLLGGVAHYSTVTGLMFMVTWNSASFFAVSVGSRLCYIP